MKKRMVLEKCLEKEEGSEFENKVTSFSTPMWVLCTCSVREYFAQFFTFTRSEEKLSFDFGLFTRKTGLHGFVM